MLFTAVIYAIIFGKISTELAAEEGSPISIKELHNYVLMIIAGLTIIRMLMPTYSPLKILFPVYYPISKEIFHIIIERFSSTLLLFPFSFHSD
jgi:hypothetical protein